MGMCVIIRSYRDSRSDAAHRPECKTWQRAARVRFSSSKILLDHGIKSFIPGHLVDMMLYCRMKSYRRILGGSPVLAPAPGPTQALEKLLAGCQPNQAICYRAFVSDHQILETWASFLLSAHLSKWKGKTVAFVSLADAWFLLKLRMPFHIFSFTFVVPSSLDGDNALQSLDENTCTDYVYALPYWQYCFCCSVWWGASSSCTQQGWWALVCPAPTEFVIKCHLISSIRAQDSCNNDLCFAAWN